MRRALPIVACLFLTVPAGAREEIPAETRYAPFAGIVTECESPGILSTIQSRFARTERRDWNSNAEIVAIERVRQHGLRSHGLDLMPRRYCEAVAVMGDRRRLRLRYTITEGAGLAGYGTGVTFCVAGYDRNLTGGAECSRLGGR
jgi:hypothetical protein